MRRKSYAWAVPQRVTTGTSNGEGGCGELQMGERKMNRTRLQRSCRLFGAGAVAAGSVLLFPGSPANRSVADGPLPVVRVEEDWRLVLNEPDDGVDSPQFHTVMAPSAALDTVFATVLWNYREVMEDFEPGGVQLLSVYGEDILRKRSVEFRQLSTSAETITWSQALQTDGTTLSFEVFNGLSATWGTFGRDMRIDESTELPDLDSYTVKASMQNSCITYGTNRVDRLSITEVRFYGPDGELIAVDSTEQVLFDIEDPDDE